MNDERASLSKVTEVTLAFWVVKIVATTLGETGGDAVTMSMHAGYLVGSLVFAALFVAAVAFQIREKAFDPALYWLTIVATTTVGTTLADLVDRSLGIGYPGGASLLLLAVLATLAVWRRSEGTVSANSIVTPRAEAFYWLTILFSQTLGTALGDWMADSNGLGFAGGAVVFAAGLVFVAAAYLLTDISRVALFWTAFVLTRPLGATLGDLLDKPRAEGGFALSRYLASGVLVALIVALVLVLPQRAGAHPEALAARDTPRH